MTEKPPSNPTPLERAIKLAGGVTKLADKLGITSQAISQWDEVPIIRAIQIERVTNGKVKRHQLRPDIFGGRAA